MADAADDRNLVAKSVRPVGPQAIPSRSGEAMRRLADLTGPLKPDGESRCLSVGRGITLSGDVNSCDKLLIEGSVDAKLTNCRAIEIAESGLFKGSTSIDEGEIRGRFRRRSDRPQPAPDQGDRPGLGDDPLRPNRDRMRRPDFRRHPGA